MLVDIPPAAQRLGTALAIGLLIGLERGWHSRVLAEGARIAGIRTFGLIGILGGVAATLSRDFGGLVLAAGLVSLALAFAIAQWRDPRFETDVSITTNIAALTAFGLGALAGTGLILEAAGAGVVAVLLLGIKPELHRLLERIERTELLATFRLLLISVVVLPVLPNRGFGPWEALNPYRLWWMVVLVAGISYVGYVATRLIGPQRGILATGALGGLISSTATVLGLSRQARDRPDQRTLLVAGMLAATAMMFPRTLLIATVIAPALSARLAPPLLAAAAVTALGTAFFAVAARRQEPVPPDARPPANPLNLKTAVQFALILAPIMLLARMLKESHGDVGLYLLSAVSGIVDIDAIALSLATMTARAETAATVAGGGILLAAAVNTMIKPAIAFVIAGRAAGVRLLLPALAATAVIALAWFLLPAAGRLL